jgi:general secretion pathway protein M
MMTPLRVQAIARWQALSPREQRGLSVLAALLAVWVFWSVAIAPALHTLRDTDHRRMQLAQQQARMLALQAQAQALQTRTPMSRDEALRSLQSLSAGTALQLQVQGDRVSVQLKAVPATTLVNWLAQARSQAQALPIEAHLTRNATSTANSAAVIWDGTLVLSLPTRSTTH